MSFSQSPSSECPGDHELQGEPKVSLAREERRCVSPACLIPQVLFQPLAPALPGSSAFFPEKLRACDMNSCFLSPWERVLPWQVPVTLLCAVS